MPKGDKFRGKLIATLPTIINKDLCRISAYSKPRTTSTIILRSKTEDRSQWRRLSGNIQEAAEAAKSKH